MRKLFFLFFLFFSFIGKDTFSQFYQWAFNIGTPDQDTGEDIAVDDSGNVYVIGQFRGTADFDPGVNVVNLTSAGFGDIYVAKYNAFGEYLWAFRIGGAGWDLGFGIALDDSENVVVTGHFAGPVDFDPGLGTKTLTTAIENSTYVYDIFLAKYNTNGLFQWAFDINKGVGYKVSLYQSGNIYITGEFSGTSDFDPGAAIANLSSSGYSDIFIAKYNNNGVYQWAINIGGNMSSGIGEDISVDSIGNVFVTGYFKDTVDFDPGVSVANLSSTDGNYNNIFVAKYDTYGTYKWAFKIGDVSNSFGYGIALDDSANVYVTGAFSQTPDFDPGPGTALITALGYDDVFVAKYNSNGTYQWAFKMGNIYNDDVGNSVSLDSYGNVYVTGSFRGTVDFDPGPGIVNLSSTYSYNFFLANYSSDGVYQWAFTNYSQGGCSGQKIFVDGSSNINVIGYFSGMCDFNPGSGTAYVTPLGIGDAFIAKYYQINLATTITDISCNGDSDGSALATAISPFPPYTYQWSNGQTTSTATGLNAGSYFVTVTDSVGSSNVADISITEPPLFIITNSSVNSNCGMQDGSASITVSGCTAPYTYLWDGNANNQTNSTATGLVNGNYCITITDSNINDTMVCIEVGNNSPIVSITSINVTCNGGNNGSANANIIGGTYPYTYLWSDSSLTNTIANLSPGTYNVTVTDSYGCIDTKNVIITEPPLITYNGTTMICLGDSIFLQGNYQNTTGTYYDTLSAINGCDSIIETNLSVVLTIAVTQDITVCNNDSVFFGGSYLTTSGTYFDTLASVSGCDSIITLNLTINPSSYFTLTQTTCDSFLFNSQTYTSSGIYTQTLTNSLGCDSITTLNLIINPSTSLIVNKIACSSYSLNNQTYTTSGTYTQMLTSAAGCDSTITLNLTIYCPEQPVIAGGWWHSIFICPDSTVNSVGNNTHGQLGDGTTTEKANAVQVSGLTNIIAVAAGERHSLFLKNDGTVWATGYNFKGQLGDGTSSSKSTPQQINGLTGITAIAAGAHHSLFLMNDSTVWAVGWNENGQLGDGTQSDKSVPVQVYGLKDVISIAGGYKYSLFVKSDGTVWAVGDNNGTGLGSNDTVVQVTGLAGIISVEAGNAHSLFLKNDGTVWGVGWNANGQLGDSIYFHDSVVQINGLTEIKTIAAGYSHSLFLKNNGLVMSVGANGNGALGDGTTIHKYSPVQVSGLSQVKSISGGFYHSLFAKDNGTIWTVGNNAFGQLGDGTLTDRSIAVPVADLCLFVGSPSILNKAANFYFYPNPFSEEMTFQTDVILKNAIVTVYNSIGQSVKQIKNISGQSFTFHRENLQNGLFFIQLTENDKIIAVGKLDIVNK